jgi:hypothetical protein
MRLPDLREEIAQCSRQGKMHDACMVRYVDLVPSGHTEFLHCLHRTGVQRAQRPGADNTRPPLATTHRVWSVRRTATQFSKQSSIGMRCRLGGRRALRAEQPPLALLPPHLGLPQRLVLRRRRSTRRRSTRCVGSRHMGRGENQAHIHRRPGWLNLPALVEAVRAAWIEQRQCRRN